MVSPLYDEVNGLLDDCYQKMIFHNICKHMGVLLCDIENEIQFALWI